MVLLELFWSFCKIGFTSFGGLRVYIYASVSTTISGNSSSIASATLFTNAIIVPAWLSFSASIFAHSGH